MSKKSTVKFMIGFPMIALLALMILVLASPSYDDIALAGKPTIKQNNGNSSNAGGQPANQGNSPSGNAGASNNSGNSSNGGGSNKSGSNASGGNTNSNKGNNGGIRGKSPSVPDDDTHGMNRGLPGPDKEHDGNNGCGNDPDREDDNNGWCGNKPTKTPQPTDPPTATPPTPTPPTVTVTPPTPTTPPPTESPTPPPPPAQVPPPVAEEKVIDTCLPKEVIVAKQAGIITVFVLNNLKPILEYHLDLPIAGSSSSDIISISPDGCWVYYSWQKAGEDQTDIYRITIDGKKIVQVTDTQDASESEPFIARNWYLYMTSTTGSQSQVEGMIENSGKRWVVAVGAELPSACPKASQITYHHLSDSFIDGAYYDGTASEVSSSEIDGSWSAWRPDSSGLIFQEKETFYTLPFTSSQEILVEGATSVALRPAGGYVAVLSTGGDLSTYPLVEWLIEGDAVQIKPIIQAGFITWWSPGRMAVVTVPR